MFAIVCEVSRFRGFEVSRGWLGVGVDVGAGAVLALLGC